jgi:hypothetical protein
MACKPRAAASLRLDTREDVYLWVQFGGKPIKNMSYHAKNCLSVRKALRC